MMVILSHFELPAILCRRMNTVSRLHAYHNQKPNITVANEVLGFKGKPCDVYSKYPEPHYEVLLVMYTPNSLMIAN